MSVSLLLAEDVSILAKKYRIDIFGSVRNNPIEQSNSYARSTVELLAFPEGLASVINK